MPRNNIRARSLSFKFYPRKIVARFFRFQILCQFLSLKVVRRKIGAFSYLKGLLLLCRSAQIFWTRIFAGVFMAVEIIGQSLPKLTLLSSSGRDIKIPDDLLGSYTVLFFYPKDQTPGCTKEACTFRDYSKEFHALNAKIFGVNADSIDSHNRFINKHALNFPLLSDPEKLLAKALGVKSFLGIISRDTFLIDPSGKVAMVWRKVNATETVLESLQELKNR